MSLINNPNGKSWYWKFNYHDRNGQLRQKSISTGISKKYGSKKEAERIGRELENKFKSKVLCGNVLKEHSNYSIQEYSYYWLEKMKGSVRDNTLESYKSVVDSHIIPILGEIVLSELDQFDLQHFIDKELDICNKRQLSIDKRLKANPDAKIRTDERPFFSSIGKHLAIVKMMLEFAYQDGDVTENVAKKINKQVLKKIPESKFVSTPYTNEEIKKLREMIIGTPIEVPVMLTSFFGFRRSEILGLKWSDIDFENKCIYVRNTVVIVNNKAEYRDGITKTVARNLPLPIEVEEYLLRLKEKQKEDKKIFGRGYRESDYICRNADGSLLKPNYISQKYKKVLNQLGLRHTRFHDLRHTVGTVILEKTGDIKLSSEILGHSNIQTTANLYTQPGMIYKNKGLRALLDDDTK